MSWLDRLQETEAAYISPSGKKHTFDYENVQQDVDNKGVAFQFPSYNGTYVQSLGHTSRKFPLKIFLPGADCDLDAEALYNSLTEQGVGTLQHPMYGSVSVIPLGLIRRLDRLKTAANQVVFEVTFWETIDFAAVLFGVDIQNEVVKTSQAFTASSSQRFASDMELARESNRFVLSADVLGTTGQIDDKLAVLAKIQDKASAKFNAVKETIYGSVDRLVGTPITVALTLSNLVKATYQIGPLLKARFEGYKNLIDSLTQSTYDDVVIPTAAISNRFQVNNLVASQSIAAMAAGSPVNDLQTREEAIEAATTLVETLATYTAWRDTSYNNLDRVDTGEDYYELVRLVNLAVGNLVTASLELPREQTIELAQARNFIELAAELYLKVDDDTLNLLINTNSLSGDELIEIPRGREITYYV